MVILLDVMMPEMDGFETATQIEHAESREAELAGRVGQLRDTLQALGGGDG